MLRAANDFDNRDYYVSIEYTVAGLLTAGLAFYLFYALLAPEKF